MLCCGVLWRAVQVGVTCNFNDVHNSRVEVRPDRVYLKQQLKAVEARVVAIQEKKRKLDQRMSVLTVGLKVCADMTGSDVRMRARPGGRDVRRLLVSRPRGGAVIGCIVM
jgi:hypothetical protein